MANTKTQKILKISKQKSDNILNWILNVAHWKKLSEPLGLSKTSMFRYKQHLKDIQAEQGSFDALAEVFTLKQLNTVIELFNDYIEHPEAYEKRKKKKQVDIEKQKEIVGTHLKDMNMNYSEGQSETKEQEAQEPEADDKAGKDNG